MKQSVIVLDDTYAAGGKQCEDEEASLELKIQALRDEKSKLDKERRKFERERIEFSIEMKAARKRVESEEKLLEMKLAVLEDEFEKVAKEREYVERQKKYYEYVIDHEKQEIPTPQIATGEMFFVGVTGEKTLKKRYKQLVKIYHPDNPDGDDGTIQEINREYDRLISNLKK